MLITECVRTQAEQDALYAKGRTAPGSIVTQVKYPNSMHCWGVAFDFCRNIKGREYDDSDGFFAKVGAVGKALGLAWGGDWTSFVDKPHLEMKGYTASKLKAQWGTPEAFFASWVSIPDGWAQEKGKWRYYKSGRMLTGWQTLPCSRYPDGCWFLFGADGTMRTGWQAVTENDAQTYLYYLDPDYGNLLTGQEIIGYADQKGIVAKLS